MPMKPFMHVLRLFLIVCLLGALAGCFGDGRGDKKISDAARAPMVESGVLLNAAVSGAAFATPTQSGLTGIGGQFAYALGEDITLTVGGIDLGTVQASEIITPVELTGSTTPVDQPAKNMFVFLQTIDENSPNYDDGIEISAATRTALEGQFLDFGTDSVTFTNDLQNILDTVLPGKTIVSEEDALANFCTGTYLPLGGQSTFGYLFPGCEGGAIVDLLTNGDFETGDASSGFIDGTPVGWDGSFNGVSLGSCLFDSCQQVPVPRSGDQVLKMFGPFVPEGAAGAYQDVEAIPGETYTASAWANNSSVDPLQGSNLADVQLFFLDANGDVIGGGPAAELLAGVDDLPVDTWVQLEVSAVAPAGTAFARIQLLHIQLNNPVTGGSIFWDDASLTGPSSGVPDGFELVFSDEFNDPGPVSPDPNKWTAEEGNGPPENPVGFGNNEWQEYTANLENLRVENGNLVIQARCEITPCISETVDPGNGSITSAKILTRDKFEFQYGIVRARIKAAGGFAAWPAFWMLGADYPITPWPNAGEIDIMELFQNNSSPFETHSTIHFCNQTLSAPAECTFENGYDFKTDSLSSTERWSDDFHIYELEWNADRIIMRVDGDEVFNNVINPAYMEEFRKPFYLILNLAMGGNLGPGGNLPPDPNRTFVETSLIDWVRVYQAVP